MLITLRYSVDRRRHIIHSRSNNWGDDCATLQQVSRKTQRACTSLLPFLFFFALVREDGARYGAFRLETFNVDGADVADATCCK